MNARQPLRPASPARTLVRPRKASVRKAKASPDSERTEASVLAGTERADSRFLETLLGYNARRAALHIIAVFLERMAVYGLRPVDFSVLSVIGHTPGITSRQLGQTLSILPPNLVGLVHALSQRGWVQRQPHPTDGRAWGLHLTPQGQELLLQAEQTAAALEVDATPRLSAPERAQLIELLQKVYLP